MRIIILTWHPFYDSRIRRHVQFLYDRNVDVSLLHFNFHDKSLSQGSFSLSGEKSFRINLPDSRLSRRKFLFSREALEMSLNVINSDRSEDMSDIIIHVHDPILLQLGTRIKNKLNTYLVYDRHELYEYSRGNLKAGFFNESRFLERVFKKKIDAVVTIAECYLEKVHRFFPYSENAAVPNYPLIKEYDHKAIDIKIKLFDSRSPIRMIYFGALETIDRDTMLMFDIVQEALLRVPNTEFRFGGPINSSELKDSIEKLKKKFNNRFFYLGQVSRETVIEETQNAHLGFHLLKPKPNSSDWLFSSPNKVFEYMACGVIPIVRARLADEDKLQDAAVIFSKDIKKTIVIENICSLLKDFQLLRRKMLNSRILSANFTWEGVAEEYLSLYKKVTHK
jgi:glycosyltransferase involved in cell wall biosynthesis